MKKIAISFLILCLSILANAQTQNSKTYNDKAWDLRKENPDSSLIYGNMAYEIALVENNQSEKVKALNFIGLAYNYKGNYAKSLEYHLNARDIALYNNDSTQYAHATNSIGRLYHSNGNFIRAYELYLEAIEIFKLTGDQLGVAYCYNSLAELYVAQNNLSKAEEMVRNAIEIRSILNDEMGKASAIIELAKIQKMNNAYIESYESYLEAEKLAFDNDARAELAEIKLGISDLYFQQENVDRGLIYANDALSLASHTNNNILTSKILLNLGKLHFLNRHNIDSEINLRKALDIVEKSSDLEMKTEAYFYLSKIKEAQGKTKSAFELFKQYNQAKEALDNTNNAREIERLEGKLVLDKFEKENEVLKAKQIRNQALIERQFILNVAVSIGLLLTILLIGFMYMSSRRKKLANAILAEKNGQIETQNKKLEELNNEKDNMMNIVAHDLQAPINNIKSLVSIIEMEGNLNDNQKNYTEKIEQSVISGKELIQDLLYVNDFESNTHKLELNMLKIDKIVQDVIDSHLFQAKEKNIDLKIELNCPEHSSNSDINYLQRILDNLISNAIKFTHIGKSIVISSYKDNDGHFKLKIKDEGQGFSTEDQLEVFKKFKKLSARPTGGESSNGLGLAIVKTLCGRLDINIALNSTMGKGSEFILTFNH